MSLYTDEIQKLQSRILELEKLGKIEQSKETSIDVNFNTINDILNEKKTQIKQNNYSRSLPLAKWYDEQLVIRLEAIFNSLKILDERLKKIEQIK